MIIYKKDDISISTIEESDIHKVLYLFNNNTFNCDFETGSLRPTENEFLEVINGIIFGKSDTDCILVLKKLNEVIGYISMYVQFDRLTIGHIAVNKEEQHKGYGSLLTRLAILFAENDDRDVDLFCAYDNNYLYALGFRSIDGVNYLYEHKDIKTEGLPSLFINIDDYSKRAAEKRELEVIKFRQFLERMKSIGLDI